jgi:hypothetical protein
MADEPKTIEATLGPYAGQRLTMSAADADAAIADGWARDPFEQHDPDAQPKEMTDEERQKALDAAEKAIHKLRGDEEAEGEADKPKEKPKAKPKPPTEVRDMIPDDNPGGYTRRDR